MPYLHIHDGNLVPYEDECPDPECANHTVNGHYRHDEPDNPNIILGEE
jgi:hypothetical protein